MWCWRHLQEQIGLLQLHVSLRVSHESLIQLRVNYRPIDLQPLDNCSELIASLQTNYPRSVDLPLGFTFDDFLIPWYGMTMRVKI